MDRRFGRMCECRLAPEPASKRSLHCVRLCATVDLAVVLAVIFLFLATGGQGAGGGIEGRNGQGRTLDLRLLPCILRP